ncbi:MAG: DUF2062 domain-containing protein, partial [Chitinophagales bacterium]|nr:DUF2062 domain-containing protein [Chitinophagales bacterium]
VLISSNISFPPAIPLVLYLSYKVGGWWLGPHAETFELEDLKTPAAIYNNLIQYLIGSFTLCTIIPALSGLLYYCILVLFQRQNTKEQAA